MLMQAEKGFVGRMRTYLAEMYPLPQRLLMSAIYYVSYTAFLQRIRGARSALLSPYTMVGIWSVFALPLILRLMDELKDREIDRELFKERPLPSGKVRQRDIITSLCAVVCLYILANSWTGKAFVMSLVVVGYAFLMFKYFFIPRILKKYLLLNLATHNPIVPVMLLHLVVLFASEHRMPLSELNWQRISLLTAMYWLVMFAWEICRKIRSREEENAYVTYSQILGRVGAVLVAASAQTAAYAISLYFYRTLSLSWVFLTIMTAGYGAAMLAHVRFAMRPSPATSKLRLFAELCILGLIVARFVDYMFILR